MSDSSNDKIKIPDYLIKLIDGCSSYVKIATNFWLVIAVFSIITVSPTKTEETKIEMPFDLGKFDVINFYPFTFVVLSLLIVCYGSTLSQAIRGRKLIQRTVDELKKQKENKDKIDLRDIIDVLIYPTLNRVAPIAQILQGDNQFFTESHNVSKKNRVLIGIYYLFLKLVITLIMYLFPGYALSLSFKRSNVYKFGIWNIPPIFFWILGIVSFFILLQLFIVELKYTFNAFKKILRK